MNWSSYIDEELSDLKERCAYRNLTVPGNDSLIHNDYLGLSRSPELVFAGKVALEEWGAGSRGSRLLGGHSGMFERVEKRIAEFFEAPASLFFGSGYAANLSAVIALGSLSDRIVSDQNIHASLVDGARLVSVPKHIIPHNEWGQAPPISGLSLFIAESVYSMSGDLVDWKALKAQMNSDGDFLILDEAHAAGILAEGGRGLMESDWDWDRMAVTVTFGKAFGVSGAAILCSERVRELIINKGRSFIYSTAPPPVVCALVEKSLDLVTLRPDLRKLLWDRCLLSREVLESHGIGSLGTDSEWGRRVPILAIPIFGEARVVAFCERLRLKGVELRPIRYPTVPRGEERIRISLNLGVSWPDTERVLIILVNEWKAFLSQA